MWDIMENSLRKQRSFAFLRGIILYHIQKIMPAQDGSDSEGQLIQAPSHSWK